MHKESFMKTKVTIKDIAKEIQVHHTTVSRALRGDSRISESTKQQVLDCAQKMGYEPNQNALNLRNRSINTIAIIIPNISHEIFARFVSLITDLASKEGFTVSIFQTKESYELEQEIVQTLIRNRVGGVIASISINTKKGTHFNRLIDYGIPLVFFDRYCKDVNAPKVEVNNYGGAVRAVNYLRNRGFSKIAHITGNPDINVFGERNKGYEDTLSALNLSFHRSLQLKKEFEEKDGVSLLQQLWEEDEKPDALLIDSFIITAGILKECKRLGIRIPQDLGLLSISNERFCDLVEPTQSVLVQPIKDLAETSFQILMAKIKSEENTNKANSIVFDFSLIERDSS